MKKREMLGKTTAAVILVGVICAVSVAFFDNRYETTDDAQIEQYLFPVSVKVPGYIEKVCFTEHQHVNKGDTLLIIDDREYQIALKQATAMLMEAKGGRELAGLSLNTVSGSASVYDYSIEEAELRVEKLKRDYERHMNLLDKKASTQVVVEQYKTELDMAKSRVEALKRQKNAARSSVSEVNQKMNNTTASILRAEAAVDMAELNVSYTVITAPADGYVGRRTIEEGQLVGAGQAITTLVPDSRRWVIANFKETQLANIFIGQSVEISIDAIPDRIFAGKVTAISSATGSKYSMIPTDNSAGNFVKIQQRVPVRIDFDDEVSDKDNLRMAAGMMCEVKVLLTDE